MTRPEAALIDELEFRSYVHNRNQFPDVLPERWALIFSNVPEMEERYLDMLSTGNILDVAPQGGTGVSDCGELPLGADAAGTDALGRRLATHPLRNEQLADSQTSTPLYLLASEIVDVVTKGYEQ